MEKEKSIMGLVFEMRHAVEQIEDGIITIGQNLPKVLGGMIKGVAKIDTLEKRVEALESKVEPVQN